MHNADLLNFDITNNFLKFSTLPIFRDGKYGHLPQQTINGGTKTYTDTVDLSSEYNINGHITNFVWFDITTTLEQPITQPINENGIFTFTSEHLNKRLRCKMTNAQFPAETCSGGVCSPIPLVYEVEIKLVNIEPPEIDFKIFPNPAQDKLTILHSKEIGNIGLYDLSGRLLRTYSGTGTI